MDAARRRVAAPASAKNVPARIVRFMGGGSVVVVGGRRGRTSSPTNLERHLVLVFLVVRFVLSALDVNALG